MATTIYVDTGATGAGTGVDVANAFTTLAAAITSLPVTLSTQTTINCRASTGVADTTSVGQIASGKAGTTAANYLLIQGNNRTGKYQTAAPYYRLESTNVSPGALYNNESSHFRVDAMQVKHTINNGSGYIGIKGTNANQAAADIDVRISNCIVWAVQTSGTILGFENRWAAAGASSTGTLRVYNCIAMQCNVGFSNDWPGSGGYFNCTAGRCSFGYSDNLAAGNGNIPMRCFNCISVTSGTSIGFTGNAGLFGSGGTSCDYCGEDDGNGVPGGGTHNKPGTTYTMVDKANNDYHLQSTDTGAKNSGTTDPFSFGVTDDIDGQTRVVQWDMGADEYIVPPPPSGEAESNYFIWSDRRR